MSSIDVVLPALGEGVTRATIADWLASPGERVEAGATLLEVMTDKVHVEVPSPATGVLAEILHEAEAEVAIGAVVGRIEAEAGAEGGP